MILKDFNKKGEKNASFKSKAFRPESSKFELLQHRSSVLQNLP